MCQLWSASHWCRARCYLIVRRYVHFSFFFLRFVLIWGDLGLFWWVSGMKLKNLFKMKVRRSKTPRGAGGQRSLSHGPQRWWKATYHQHCRYSTAVVLQADPNRSRTGPAHIPRWLKKDCRTGFLIPYSLHLRSTLEILPLSFSKTLSLRHLLLWPEHAV